MNEISEVLLSPEDEWLRQGITCINQDGYPMYGTVHLHTMILLKIDERVTDHLNQIKTDCRRENLRRATKRQNALNSKIRSDNPHGIKGVRWMAVNKKWEAYCRVEGKRQTLYYGPDFFEACCARKSYEVTCHD